MKLLLAISVILALFETCHGAATSVSVSITDETDTLGAGTLITKLGSKVTITCTYDGTPGFSHSFPLQMRVNSSSEYQKVAEYSGLSPPWSDMTDIYASTSAFESNPFTLSFQISAVGLRDNGEYACRALTLPELSDALTPATVKLMVSANTDNVFLSGVTDIDGVPTYKLEDQDRAQTVTCMAYNGSQPVMTLFINAVEIKDFTVTTAGNNHTGVLTHDFSVEDSGKQIKCVATSPGFQDTPRQDTATIRIESKPVISCEQDELEGVKDQTVYIKCTITANPAIDISTVSWTDFDNGHNIAAEEIDDSNGLVSTLVTTSKDAVATLAVTLQFDNFPKKYTLQVANSVDFAVPKTITIIKKRVVGPIDDGSNSGSRFYSLSAFPVITISLLRKLCV